MQPAQPDRRAERRPHFIAGLRRLQVTAPGRKLLFQENVTGAKIRCSADSLSESVEKTRAYHVFLLNDALVLGKEHPGLLTTSYRAHAWPIRGCDLWVPPDGARLAPGERFTLRVRCAGRLPLDVDAGMPTAGSFSSSVTTSAGARIGAARQPIASSGSVDAGAAGDRDSIASAATVSTVVVSALPGDRRSSGRRTSLTSFGSHVGGDEGAGGDAASGTGSGDSGEFLLLCATEEQRSRLYNSFHYIKRRVTGAGSMQTMVVPGSTTTAAPSTPGGRPLSWTAASAGQATPLPSHNSHHQLPRSGSNMRPPASGGGGVGVLDAARAPSTSGGGEAAAAGEGATDATGCASAPAGGGVRPRGQLKPFVRRPGGTLKRGEAAAAAAAAEGDVDGGTGSDGKPVSPAATGVDAAGVDADAGAASLQSPPLATAASFRADGGTSRTGPPSPSTSASVPTPMGGRAPSPNPSRAAEVCRRASRHSHTPTPSRCNCSV